MAQKTKTGFQILTANRLRDGAVLYWKDGAWVDALADADVFESAEAADAALEAGRGFVRNQYVVTPYLFDVVLDKGTVKPVREREIIRAAGPTIRTDLGKQAKPSLEAFDVSI
ncbi:MAG TPA: DUF2849 domain-containing protein [Rhizomicrobium sp.]|jgi:hypothetical protein|nr:DUF2849 domain-containing protein [Rhizomicrobium sp.]